MPVDFLSDEQAQSYAQFRGDLSATELAQFFYLDASDQVVLTGRRGSHNRLGIALQVCCARFLVSVSTVHCNDILGCTACRHRLLTRGFTRRPLQ